MGKRIIFKDDRDSGIGRGGVLCVEHVINPHVMRILESASATLPFEADGVLRITEGWRPAMHERDLHTEFAAFDLGLHFISVLPRRVNVGALWVRRLKYRLGGDYDVVMHGEGSNLHIHAEYDPEPE